MTSSDLLVVAGEASGDLHGARLLAALGRRLPGLRAFGLGSDPRPQPALRPARQCLVQLRQLGLAAQCYWDDHENRLFRYRTGSTNGGDVYWFGWLARGSEGTRSFDPTMGALYPYLQSRGVELCPSLNHALREFKSKAIGAAHGYGYNLHASSPPNAPVLTLARAETTANTVLFADAAQVNTFQAPASPSHPMLEEFYYISATEPTAHFRHLDRAQIAKETIRDMSYLRTNTGTYFRRPAFLYAVLGVVLAGALGLGTLMYWKRVQGVPPATAVEKAVEPEKTPSVKKNVALSFLARQHYGFVNPTILDFLLEHNPHITVMNRIPPDEPIEVPPLTEEQFLGTDPDGKHHIFLGTFDDEQSIQTLRQHPLLQGKTLKTTIRNASSDSPWYRLTAGHRGLDEAGRIERDVDRDPRGSRPLDVEELLEYGVRDGHGVRARLLPHAEADGGKPVEARDVPVVLGAHVHIGDVAEPDHAVALVRHHDGRELLGPREVAAGVDRELAPRAFDPAGGDLGVLGAQGVLDVRHRHRVGGEALGIEPHPHRVLAVAADDHAAHAVEALELIGDHVVGQVRELERAEVLPERTCVLAWRAKRYAKGAGRGSGRVRRSQPKGRSGSRCQTQRRSLNNALRQPGVRYNHLLQRPIMSDTPTTSTHADENFLIAERRAKLAELRKRGVAFPNDSRRADYAGDLQARYGDADQWTAQSLEANAPRVAIAGRIMLKRVMGKASFVQIQDESGRIQLFDFRPISSAKSMTRSKAGMQATSSQPRDC